MEQEHARLIIGLLGMVYMRTLLLTWLKELHTDTLMLDEEKAATLFPWILSGVFDEALMEEVLGLSEALCQEIRQSFLN